MRHQTTRAQVAIESTKKRQEKDELKDEFAYFRAVYDGLQPTAEPVKEKPKNKAAERDEQLLRLDEMTKLYTQK